MSEHEYDKMRELGDERVVSNQKRASAKGALVDSISGNKLLQRSVHTVMKCLREYIAAQPERSEARALLEIFDGKDKRLIKFVGIAMQHILGDYASTRRQVALAGKIGRAIEDELMLEMFRKNNKAEYTYRKSRIAKWKFNNKHMDVSYLKKMGKEKAALVNIFSHRERSLVGMLFIEAAVMAAIIQYDRKWIGGKTYHCIEPRPDVLDWLMKADESLKLRRPFWLPITSQPEEYKSLYEGGYKSEKIRARPCIKIKSDKHRELVLKADMPTFYNAMNLVSRTAFRVNPVIIEALKHIWAQGGGVTNVPSFQDLPAPVHPGEDAPLQERRNYYEKVTIHKAIQARNLVDRKKIADILMVCRMFAGKDFYFPHHADARGRMYPVASTISPQGNNLQRALTMFADSREVTSRGEYWLKINAANHYGNDKLTLQERLKWANDNAQMFIEIAKDPIGTKDIWLKADGRQKPWTFLAAAHELGSFLIAKAEGRPYHSHIPIYVDCSASGFQHLALLALDQEAAEKVNVAPTEAPKDIYTETAKALLKQLEESADVMAVYWVSFFKQHPKAIRKIAKKVVMTTPYSVSPHAAREYVNQELDAYLKSVGLEPEYGTEVFKRTAFLSRNLMSVIRKTNRSAFAIMDYLRDIGRALAMDNKTFAWTTPSGFIAYQATFNINRQVVKYLSGGKTKFYRLGSFDSTVSKRGSMNGIVPNFIHSLDAAALHIAISRVWEQGVRGMTIIHDAFGGLADDMDIINASVRESMANIYSEDQLKKFSEEVLALLDSPSTLLLPERGSFDPRQVCLSDYFLS